MNRQNIFFGFALCIALWGLVGSHDRVMAQSKVELLKNEDGFQLLRNGKPYSIKGVGGQTRLEMLAKLGGNSIRTWSADGIEKVLDQAHELGLTVSVGFWLGHERHGFNYQDQESVLRQHEKVLAIVRKVKDHPAVLLWSIGNEAEGSGNNPAVWYAINHIARDVKKIDPNHPTMTVIAELGEKETKIKSIEKFCPHIDIVGINSYGGIHSVAERFIRAKVSKPYIVTEHGPLGPWECGKTEWNAPIEFTSTEKSKWYADGYRAAVVKQKGLCLGSYAFLWGHKQETTATWFGMLLPDGTRLGPVDAMSELWTGVALKNKCPEISSLKLDKTSGLKAGDKLNALASVSDPDGDALKYKWVLRTDSGVIGAGGDAQNAEQDVDKAVIANGKKAQVTVPDGGGAYRLFLYAYDNQGGAAVANVPLNVSGPVKKIPAKKATLPYTVYNEGETQKTFIASGYMGNTKDIEMDLNCQDNPHQGKTCIKVQYKSTSEWGGVLWQSPPDDWTGKLPGGLDFTGATQLEFWVRGAQGGEKVNFLIGAIGGTQLYRDSAKVALDDAELSSEWEKKTISLKDKDLSRIKTAFGWSLEGQADPVTFYIDNIRIIKE